MIAPSHQPRHRIDLSNFHIRRSCFQFTEESRARIKGKPPPLNFPRSVQNFDERARTFHPCLRSTWLILLSPLCATTLLLVSKRRVGIADAGAENRDGGGGWWVSSGKSTSQSSDYDDKSFLSP